MLGLEMSDGSKCVSLPGASQFPPLPPLGLGPQGGPGCTPVTDYNANGSYGNNNNIDDVTLGSHDTSYVSDELCDVTNGLDHGFRNLDDHQEFMEPKKEPEPGTCAACGEQISDRYYLLAVDRQWHLSCLRCAECRLPLDSEVTCFARDNNIYCKEDYYRLFGLKQCARCHVIISPNELVMKARDLVYHLNCFTCATCGKVLTPGEHFGMSDCMIYCRTHYEQNAGVHEGYPPQTPGGCGGMDTSLSPSHSGGRVVFYNGVGSVQKGRPRKRKSPLPEVDIHGLHMGNFGLDGDLSHMDGMQLHAPRQKRMRTSFKHHQLRIMKSYFALNHNPDAKDLKQLAQKTGLNKRVLQVWFQNARAKYRRNLLKQDGDKTTSTSQDGSQSAGEEAKPLPSSGSGLSDISGVRSPALSDLSSGASLSDFQTSLDDSSAGANLTTHALNNNFTQSSELETELFGQTL